MREAASARIPAAGRIGREKEAFMAENTMENQDYEQNLLTLTDEEGQEHEFEIVDTMDLDDERYMALVPVFADPQDSLEDSGELVILKVVPDDENGEELLQTIEDDDEFNRVADLFMERLEDYFEFEEADEE